MVFPRLRGLRDCQTCFLCELYCPVDALYVSPFKDARETINEANLVERGLLGSYRRALGWRGNQGLGSGSRPQSPPSGT